MRFLMVVVLIVEAFHSVTAVAFHAEPASTGTTSPLAVDSPVVAATVIDPVAAGDTLIADANGTWDEAGTVETAFELKAKDSRN
ncbi:MAG: hypothetical protein L3J31_08270, partial [Bacteroidales bacterium]|nr:hypothetical protein [Bacteroidales bacterium]